jgi:hypothetical protein
MLGWIKQFGLRSISELVVTYVKGYNSTPRLRY